MPLPPTLRQLLEDPFYRRMFTTAPRPVFCQSRPGARPWVVYARTIVETADGDSEVRWRGARYPTYPDAFRSARDALRAVDGQGELKYDDVALVSRSVLYPPPPGFQWFGYPGGHLMHWCGRCRRPTNFRVRHKHHALKGAPALTRDEPRRCYYCGMRQAGQPAYRAVRLDPT